MKRTTTLLAAGLVASSGLASVAYAQEASLYGSVRSGVYYSDQKGTDATWDLGSVDAGDLHGSIKVEDTKGDEHKIPRQSGDKLWSRIGVRASYDLDGGMTSGLHIEKRLDNFRTRHQNVWLQGAFGRLTLGQQGSTFHSAVTWDNTNLFGGWSAVHGGSRRTGLKFATMLEGPFNVEAMIQDDGSNGDGSGDSALDRRELSANIALGSLATVSAGYLDQDDGGMDAWGGSVGGSAGGLSWDAGYVASRNLDTDWKRYGLYGGYAMGPGTIYAYYEDLNDHADENDYLLFGYSHSLGTNTRIIVEHQRADVGQNRTALAVRVDF